ncbi:MAG: NAD-dependent protein deacylase, partial [Candidatus Heimdallarchaeota archaeon]|nr:NAD-dependent protein deacylase [Candidatus Heimdallarchaeota archaeon]
RAGNKKLHNIHGDILSARCIDDCGAEDVFWTAPLKEVPPHCDCGAFLRPNVIWFGESLPFQVLDQSLNDIALAKILLVIGTSGVVHPVASFPLMAKRNGSFLIEFNIEPTPLSPLMDLTFFGPVEKPLPEFIKKLSLQDS